MMNVVSVDPETKMRDKFQPGAFIGTVFVAGGILDGAVVYHGVSGCNAMAQHFRGDLVPNGGYVPVIPSGFLETETIMGGAGKLERTLRAIAFGEPRPLMSRRPSCVWICLSDAPAVGGDDIEGVAKRMAEETGLTILPVDNPGFKGGVVLGAELALTRVLDEVVEPSDAPKAGINLVAPFLMGSANWPFDIDYLVELLEAADVKVNLVLSRNITFGDLKRFSRAEANYLLTYDEMPDFVRKSEAVGVPTWDALLPLPFGMGNTEEWYLALADRFGSVEKAKQRLVQEMGEVQRVLHRNYNFSWMASFLSDKYAAVCGPAPFAAAMTRYLFHDLNVRVRVVGLWSESEQGIRKAETVLQPLSDCLDFTVLEDPTYHQLGEAVREANVDFVVGSMQDKPLFRGLGFAHVNLAGFYYFNNYNFVPWPLAGVKGSLRLFSEVSRVVEDAFYETEAWRKLAFTPARDGD
jgi:nitrogenase molybdenum-iron protein alpha/beta subunit